MNEGELKAQITELLMATAAMFPQANMKDENYVAYVNMLKDIPLPILRTTLEQCAAEAKFWPSIAEIREKAAVLTQPPRPPALQAWASVMAAVQRYGRERSLTALQVIEAENPIAAAAARALGWTEICNSENQVADRAHFSKIYDQLAARKDADDRLLPAARDLRLQSGQPVVAQLTERKS